MSAKIIAHNQFVETLFVGFRRTYYISLAPIKLGAVNFQKLAFPKRSTLNALISVPFVSKITCLYIILLVLKRQIE